MQPGYAGTITNLRIVLNTQKNPYFNEATQQNTCQNFPTQNIPKSNISNPKKSFDHPWHLKSGNPEYPPPPGCNVHYWSSRSPRWSCSCNPNWAPFRPMFESRWLRCELWPCSIERYFAGYSCFPSSSRINTSEFRVWSWTHEHFKRRVLTPFCGLTNEHWSARVQ